MAGLSNGRRRFLFRRRVASPGFPHVAPRTINSAFRHSFFPTFVLVRRTLLRASCIPRSSLRFGASTTCGISRTRNVLVRVLVAIAVLTAFSLSAVAQQTESREPGWIFRLSRVARRNCENAHFSRLNLTFFTSGSILHEGIFQAKYPSGTRLTFSE